MKCQKIITGLPSRKRRKISDKLNILDRKYQEFVKAYDNLGFELKPVAKKHKKSLLSLYNATCYVR